ncbi:hypothetical protein CK203_002348 [Vitis vinifera]|uniref:Uncharacterized protein n=1 Tax=Vitis vinifera TaxID=29760 RepID=A0A438KK13_VITVI|nr:hypothetical protein CK203_002348 [Vitis vinifera]
MKESEPLIVNVRAEITNTTLVAKASSLWVMEIKGGKSLAEIGVRGEVERPTINGPCRKGGILVVVGMIVVWRSSRNLWDFGRRH